MKVGPRSVKPKDFADKMNKLAADIARASQEARVELEKQAIIDDTSFVGEQRRQTRKGAMKRAAETSRATGKRRKTAALT